MMTADPIWVGGVYVEEDIGSDKHGDSFHVTFKGGAPGTQLTRLIIDGDLNTPGFGLGDLFFDTQDSGLGADHSFGFQITRLTTANPNASVRATVLDGSTKLTLDFTNFQAGDTLVFSIDVDEAQNYDPNETDLAAVNSGFDPITSGVEFQNSLFKAEFTNPNYEVAVGQNKFLNRYDTHLAASGLPLPADDFEGKRDRTAGTTLSLQQVPKPISLSGVVYVDNNYSLTLDSGEQRLANVELELYRQQAGSNFVSTGFKTVTDSEGAYSFGTSLKLMPGVYQVRETQPAGYLSVGATRGVITGGLPVGQTVQGNPDWLTEIEIPLGDQHATLLNFAEALPASIAGRVTVVRNGLDCDDPNGTEEAIPDVTVELRDTSGTLLATQKTDANGRYRFENLRSGVYSLREITPTGMLEGDAHVGTIATRVVGVVAGGSEIKLISLQGGNAGVDYNFCELLPSDLSGHVYVDRNDNGLRESGETPIGSVALILWNDAGSKVGQTVTDAQGFYRFDNLTPGRYRITEEQPSGYLPGKATVGTIDSLRVGTTDNTGNAIAQVTIPSGIHAVDYDFGELLPGSIAGRVIVDTNGNCIVDAAGDMPLQGVRLELLNQNGNVLQTTFSDANGNYRFENLVPGEYSVREIQPQGYFHGGQRHGSGGGDDRTDDVISAITLVPGDDLVDYIFCEIPPADLSGLVFVDNDRDCFFDSGETLLAGVKVTLLDASGHTVATTTTDATGRYRFTNLRPGSYSLREEQPDGYLQGGQRAGSGGGNDSVADVISAIAIGAGQSLVDYSFCEVLPSSIAGQVFVDLDFDCQRSADEKPLAGVTVELLDDGGRVIERKLTDANGQYSFIGLRPGKYTVRETQVAGYFHGGQTAPSSGGDASIDDVVSGIELTGGQAIAEVNFCEVPPARISGFVFQDGPPIITNNLDAIDLKSVRDGKRTIDDTPIGKVRLQLRTIAGTPIDSSRALAGVYTTRNIEVETDENGYFEFIGLRAGVYNIYQLQPDGYHDGIDTPGSTGGFSINKGESQTSEQFQLLMQSLTMDDATNPGFDAILLVNLEPNQHSINNDFSEVVTTAPPKPQQPPPLPYNPPPPPDKVIVTPDQWATPATLPWQPVVWSPEEPLIGFAHQAPPTWHLSVINGGFPRGRRNGETVRQSEVAAKAELLDVDAWAVRGMKESRWTIVSTGQPKRAATSRMVFDVPGAKPVAGDFNGDGVDELALYVEGEWFVDLNGNGVWDEADVWLKMGDKKDQPVVGDWDGDGKDDVGIFGRTWSGDERALSAETGLPDPENLRRAKAKNVPPRPEEAPDEPRLLQRSMAGPARSDLIDHVFRFGSEKDVAVTGDFNGDGISTIGVYREGSWVLDVDGDGLLTPGRDRETEFGEVGDLPLVADFDGDGIDDLAIVRGNQVIVDTNHNGRVDATDQLFLLENQEGTVVVGDFDGDGKDEPALHQSVSQRRTLEARRGN